MSGANGQSCFWFSNGCSIGCDECDGNTRGPVPKFIYVGNATVGAHVHPLTSGAHLLCVSLAHTTGTLYSSGPHVNPHLASREAAMCVRCPRRRCHPRTCQF